MQKPKKLPKVRSRKDKQTASFVDMYIDYENPYGLTKKQYELITTTLNYYMVLDMIDNGSAYVLPNKLGMLTIIKLNRAKNPIPDFGLAWATGQIIPHRNRHSRGEFAKFQWFPTIPYAEFPTKGVWRYKPHRDNKKLLSDKIINENTIANYTAV